MAGCVADPRVDDDAADVVVVRGYLESGELHRWIPCAGPQDFLDVVNCAPGLRSTARLVVDEAIVGTPHAQRLQVRFSYAAHWPELDVGKSTRYLAVLLRERRRYELHGVAAIVPTADGGWAIPATYDEQVIWFPCSADRRDLEPLRFEAPRPRELVSALRLDAREIDEVDDDGAFTLEDGYLYANVGVPLIHAGAVYAGKSASTVVGACH